MSQPSVITADELNRGVMDVAPVKVSISGTTALSSVLVVGATYFITADTDCFWLQTGSDGTVTTANSNPLWAKQVLGPIKVTATGNTASQATAYIAAITTGASGSLYIMRVR